MQPMRMCRGKKLTSVPSLNHDVANAGQDNTHKDANDEVVDTHDQNNGYNGKVLELMTLAECVP